MGLLGRYSGFIKGAGFFLLSLIATSFPLLLGRWLWPQGLSAGTENLFWPATAVHFAGFWVLGARFWPVVILSVLSSQVLLGRQWETSLLNAAGNAAESLVMAWAVRKFSADAAPFQTVRGVLVLVLAAIFGPLCSSVPGAGTLVIQGWVPRGDYLLAIGVWNFANATSVLLLAPFLIWIAERGWARWHWTKEKVVCLGIVFLCGWIAFEAVFRIGGGVNFAFLVFPAVIYAAVRFGQAETAISLFLVMGLVYLALIMEPPILSRDRAHAAVWFIQTFGFILGGTGLLLAARTEEGRRAEAQIRTEQKRTLEASVREGRATLDALRYQMNPHFLFNSLNSIRATLPLALEDSRQMVTELAEYLRSTLSRTERDLVPLREEVESVEHYLTLEKMRFGEALGTLIKIDERVSGFAVPVFVLQPLVENAIRHGFDTTSGDFKLNVTAEPDEEGLYLEVANTGVWRESAGSRGAGVGMENVRQRLLLIYGERAELKVKSESGWVYVQLRIPHRV